MTTSTRYALEREGHPKFYPVVGGIAGFDSATAAMLHLFEVLPNEAHEWHWVPLSPSQQEVPPCQG